MSVITFLCVSGLFILAVCISATPNEDDDYDD